MFFLFILILISACAFSLALFFTGMVINPFVYVLIGWSAAVSAHYFSYWFDIFKIVILNRSFQAFVVNGEGEYWTGAEFVADETTSPPLFVYNDLQVDKLIKNVIKLTGNNDLYVRIMPQEDIEEI